MDVDNGVGNDCGSGGGQREKNWDNGNRIDNNE